MVLKHLDAEEGEPDSETVHAKFVVGTDGQLLLSLPKGNLMISQLYTRCAFVGTKELGHRDGGRTDQYVQNETKK